MKFKEIIPLIIFLAILVAVHFLYVCADTISCPLRGIIWNTTFTTLDPALVFTQLAVIPAVLICFIPRKVFYSWLKFAAWAIPLAIIFIAFTPVNSNAFMDFFPFYRDDAARLAGELFATISLILIVYKWLVARRHEKHL